MPKYTRIGYRTSTPATATENQLAIVRVPAIAASERCATAVDETCQVRDGTEMLTRLFRIRVDLHVVAFADGNAELEGIDRIETQTRTEQRCFAIDLLHTDVLQIQDIDEQLFELPF